MKAKLYIGGDKFFNDNPIAGTRFLWNGSAGGTMVKINGPIFGSGLSNIFLDCNRTTRAAIGLQLISANNGYFKGIKIVSYSSIGLDMNVQPVASINGEANGIGTTNNIFDGLQIFNPDTPSIAIKLDGWNNVSGYDCCQNIFR